MLGKLLLFVAAAFSAAACATEFQVGVLPGFSARGQAMAVLRLDATLLFGGDAFKFGPYGFFEALAPQVIDTSYGGAIRLGNESYLQIQGGIFRRSFKQEGSPAMSGQGFSGELIYGMHLTPHVGIDVVLSGKRISSGDLDKRWIVDLLPVITVRGDF
jgi:hypothetical protein